MPYEDRALFSQQALANPYTNTSYESYTLCSALYIQELLGYYASEPIIGVSDENTIVTASETVTVASYIYESSFAYTAPSGCCSTCTVYGGEIKVCTYSLYRRPLVTGL
jgi:hypothetical protein